MKKSVRVGLFASVFFAFMLFGCASITDESFWFDACVKDRAIYQKNDQECRIWAAEKASEMAGMVAEVNAREGRATTPTNKEVFLQGIQQITQALNPQQSTRPNQNSGNNNSALSSSRQNGQSSMPTGKAALIPLTPPGNARSRNECVKVELLDAPIAKAKTSNSTLSEANSFGTSRNGSNVGQKQYAAYSTCNESLVIYVLACSQGHMTDAGSVGQNSWFSGQFTGIHMLSDLRTARDDTRLWVASEYFSPNSSQKNQGSVWKTVAVYYGAWPAADIYTTSGFTENGNSLGRKQAALSRLAVKVLNTNYGQSGLGGALGSSFPYPEANWLSKGVQTCKAFTANDVWKSTP